MLTAKTISLLCTSFFIAGYFVMEVKTSGSSTNWSDKGENKRTSGGYKQYHEQLVNSLKAERLEEFSR